MGDGINRRGRRQARALAAGLLLVGTMAAGAGAQPAQDCDHATWSLDRDRDALGTPREPDLRSGATLRLPADGAVVLGLSPLSVAGLPHPPTRVQDSGNGGFLRLTVPEPGGIWQVTISASAWVDVFAGGRPIDPVAFTGPRNCPGVRKSLRFRLPPGEVVLQIAGGQDLRVAIYIRDVEKIPVPAR